MCNQPLVLRWSAIFLSSASFIVNNSTKQRNGHTTAGAPATSHQNLIVTAPPAVNQLQQPQQVTATAAAAAAGVAAAAAVVQSVTPIPLMLLPNQNQQQQQQQQQVIKRI